MMPYKRLCKNLRTIPAWALFDGRKVANSECFAPGRCRVTATILFFTSRLAGGGIEVLHVLHGARDVDAIVE
jgi:hypothetical protein